MQRRPTRNPRIQIPNPWAADILASKEHYDAWYVPTAQGVAERCRIQAEEMIATLFFRSNSLLDLSPRFLLANPDLLHVLRFCTEPVLARDRIAGIADIRNNVLARLEEGKIAHLLPEEAERAVALIQRLLPRSLYGWLAHRKPPSPDERQRAILRVATNLARTLTDTALRNLQQDRQDERLRHGLIHLGYTEIQAADLPEIREIGRDQFCLRYTVQVGYASRIVNLALDYLVGRPDNRFPRAGEEKSAGDFTNTNKRQKEEAKKHAQLIHTFGPQAGLTLFLGGYFNAAYLSYMQAEGVRWVWEHDPQAVQRLIAD